MSKSLDRLVGGAIFSETDRVVSGNPDDPLATESGEADSTSGIGDEVLSSTVSDPAAVLIVD